MKSARQARKIAWVIRVPLGTVDAYNVTLAEWLQNTSIHPIYMLVRSPDLTGKTMSFQGIISKLRDTYGHLGVRFSVVSTKRGRMLISASSLKETTKLEPQHLPDGPPSSLKHLFTSGTADSLTDGDDDAPTRA